MNSAGVVTQSINPAPANGDPKFLTGLMRLETGNTLVTWVDVQLPGGVPTDANVFGILLNDAGVAVGSAFQINSSSADVYADGQTIQTGAGAIALFNRLVPIVGSPGEFTNP